MAKSSTSPVFEKFTPALLIVTIGLAFLVGILWQKVTNLEKGGTNAQVAGAAGNPAPADISGKLTEDQAKNLPAVTDSDHIQGSKDADVIMVEYSDFECPFCEKFHPTAHQALDEYGDKIAWVYRHYPLETLHPRAYPAAIASECVVQQAGNSGFWTFADMIFSDQEKYLTDDGLREAAVAAGADGATFDSCYSSKATEQAIRDMAAGGDTAGVTGTPATFLVNKKGEVWLIPGALPYESLKASIEEALGN